MEFQVLLDAPAKPVSRIQIAKLGSFNDARYGDFDITTENVANWQRHLSKLPGGEALIDFEHRSERKPRDSQAAGWITGIDLDGDRVMADTRWTPLGERAIKDEVYRFVSPVYGPTQVENETLDDALPSVALTNKPFLGTMPALCLASEERVSEALTDELTRLLDHASALTLTSEQRDSLTRLLDTTPAPADSRGADMDTATLIKTLDLADDADEAKILEALSELKVGAEKAAKLEKKLGKNPVKTLEQQAADAGLVVLDAAEVRTLQANALAGAEARKQLHAERFDRAFDAALNDPNGARVKPAEKDRLHKFYLLDAEETLKLIEEREPIVQAKPSGQPYLELDGDTPVDPEQATRAGVLPSSIELDQKIRAHIKAQNLPNTGENYVKVLDQYQSGALTL